MRERRDDIPLLAGGFVERLAHELGVTAKGRVLTEDDFGFLWRKAESHGNGRVALNVTLHELELQRDRGGGPGHRSVDAVRED